MTEESDVPGPLGRRPKLWVRPIEELPVVEYLGGPVFDEKRYHLNLAACRAAHNGDLTGVLVRPVIERRLPVPNVLQLLYAEWSKEVAITVTAISVAAPLIAEVERLRAEIALSAPIVWMPAESRIEPGDAVAELRAGEPDAEPLDDMGGKQ